MYEVVGNIRRLTVYRVNYRARFLYSEIYILGVRTGDLSS